MSIDGPADTAAAMDAVKTGEHDVVLVIPEAFGEQLAGMIPARIELVSDQANSDADRDARRVRNSLYAYNQDAGRNAGYRARHQSASPAAPDRG